MPPSQSIPGWFWLPVLLLIGCPPHVPLPAGAILDPVQLRDRLVARQTAVRNVRGEAKVDLFTKEGYSPFSQVVVAERPGQLHIEVLSPFDAPLGILTSDGLSFQLYSLEQKVFYHGPATPRNLARLLPLPLPPGDLVETLLGGVPLLPHPRRVSWDERAGHYLLELEQEGGPTQQLRIEPEHLDVTVVRLETVRGKLIYRISYEDWQRVTELRLPRTFHFEMPGEELDLTMTWKDREINVEIPAEAWRQEPPRGARLELLP